jgi:hypothetical protein
MVETVDISGMGGRYEAACQIMLERGLTWLKDHPDFNVGKSYKQLKGVFGICTSEEALAKEMDAYICAEIEPSGAMHHAIIQRLTKIQVVGYDQWVKDAKAAGGTIYEVDHKKLREELKDLGLS